LGAARAAGSSVVAGFGAVSVAADPGAGAFKTGGAGSDSL
jgi:hypothetical protein